MTIKELVAAIAVKHKGRIDVNPPATAQDIASFEHKAGFKLPADFIEFYSICNGFICDEDIFQISKLEDMLDYQSDYGPDWVKFSDYMINSDLWYLRVLGDNQYEILNHPQGVRLTNKLSDYLHAHLMGDVFDPGGIYEWQEAIIAKSS